jgi:hypothetical protein
MSLANFVVELTFVGIIATDVRWPPPRRREIAAAGADRRTSGTAGNKPMCCQRETVPLKQFQANRKGDEPCRTVMARVVRATCAGTLPRWVARTKAGPCRMPPPRFEAA